ncbi:MAG TPA: cellulase family glycosylhydrolase [Puia sp.]|jgi:endoglucanase|nr:cellulase family glycosylhydrolase [Puia sp.]
MKSKLLVFLFLVFSLYFSAAQPKFISVKGKEIIGVDGKNFLMKGTNLGNWLVPEGYMFKFKSANCPRLINEVITELIGPDDAKNFWQKYLNTYITHADIHYLKTIGVNSIRIPFNYRLFTNEDYLGGRGDARGFKLMDSVISWCKKEGIFVMLDMHCAPGGQTGDNIDDGYGYPFLFENEGNQKLVVEIWKKIAAHYKDETTIMGYDLLNEPIAHYFDKEKLNPLLEVVYKKITKAIRSVDKNHILFLGGAQWDSNFGVFGPPFDNKLVYTFHKYWTEPTQKVIQDYIDFRNKYNVPIYCGETGENSDDWVKNFRLVLEKNNIGWHYWPYKKIDNSRGFVTFAVPQNYDTVMQYADTSRMSFEQIRKAKPKNIEQVKQALDGFLNNCKFINCTPNKGYIEALGFRTDK